LVRRVVRDHNDQQLAYVNFEDEAGAEIGGDGLATPGFGGREALFGLILAHISRFDFSLFCSTARTRH
jgi:hypothetical protein